MTNFVLVSFVFFLILFPTSLSLHHNLPILPIHLNIIPTNTQTPIITNSKFLCTPIATPYEQFSYCHNFSYTILYIIYHTIHDTYYILLYIMIVHIIQKYIHLLYILYKNIYNYTYIYIYICMIL